MGPSHLSLKSVHAVCGFMSMPCVTEIMIGIRNNNNQLVMQIQLVNLCVSHNIQIIINTCMHSILLHMHDLLSLRSPFTLSQYAHACRDITASLIVLAEVCTDVKTEPDLQPLTGEFMHYCILLSQQMRHT